MPPTQQRSHLGTLLLTGCTLCHECQLFPSGSAIISVLSLFLLLLTPSPSFLCFPSRFSSPFSPPFLPDFCPLRSYHFQESETLFQKSLSSQALRAVGDSAYNDVTTF